MAVAVGQRLPSSLVAIVKYEEGEGYSNEIVDMNEYFENKNVVLIGFPGAFTPTCMTQQLPDFLSKALQIKKQGADEIIAMAVNDPFVIAAFAEYL